MNKIFCTIDLEDFSYDYPRSLGINLKPALRELAIIKNYNQVNQICKKFDLKMTFFCTGILAKLFPDIIRQISSDGHEIASQYFYHDRANKDEINVFEKRISESINILTKYSKNKICGFRAPYFSLTTDDYKYYQILEKYFQYDSSLLLNIKNHKEEVEKINNNLVGNLEIYPVLFYGIFPKIKLRLGGSYFKILPFIILKNLSQKILNHNHCIIYLHPYDYDNSFSYMNEFRVFSELDLVRRIYYYIKQIQWFYFGNDNVLIKLDSLLKLYSFENLLKDLKN
jgi:peptidoglycan/xylan/chitin deacetylase (PgdA/CDA1 family)